MIRATLKKLEEVLIPYQFPSLVWFRLSLTMQVQQNFFQIKV